EGQAPPKVPSLQRQKPTLVSPNGGRGKARIWGRVPFRGRCPRLSKPAPAGQRGHESMRFENRSGWVLAFLAGLVLAGCQAGTTAKPGGRSKLGRVVGTVTYAGQPVRRGTVVFKPDAARGTKGPQAFSGIGEDGTFTLSTLETDDGAVVGTHK